jgi:hypothetical protein
VERDREAESHLARLIACEAPHPPAPRSRHAEVLGGDWPGNAIGPKRIDYFEHRLCNRAKLGQFFLFVHGIARLTGRNPALFTLDDNYIAWPAFGHHYDHEGGCGLSDYLKPENDESIKAVVHYVKIQIASATSIERSGVLRNGQSPFVLRQGLAEQGRNGRRAACIRGARESPEGKNLMPPVKRLMDESRRGLRS